MLTDLWRKVLQGASGKTVIIAILRGMWWCSWLRHYSASWKAMGWIPDGVIGFFLINLSFWLHCGPGVDWASNRN